MLLKLYQCLSFNEVGMMKALPVSCGSTRAELPRLTYLVPTGINRGRFHFLGTVSSSVIAATCQVPMLCPRDLELMFYFKE